MPQNWILNNLLPFKSLAAGFILFIYFDTFSSQLSLLDPEFRMII